NIGAGLTHAPHMGVIKDLRLVCMLRRRALAERGVTQSEEPPEENRTSTLQTAPVRKRVSQMSVAQLAEALGTAKGLRLRMILTELGKHKGEEAIGALGSAASAFEGDYQKLAQESLYKLLDELDDTALKKKLKDDRG